ncbi:MAG: iron-sulfur cluster assembly scaffold protein [Thermoplasmata archaeon]|nr:iron-sulfur cluster assembly scaffold protein [Thermoplasmata archaeon]
MVRGLQKQIDAEEEKEFSAKVLREYREPRNVGRIEGADSVGKILGPCGDTMEFSIKIEDGRIKRILFMTDGCGPSIACGSMTTRLAAGNTIEEALNIKGQDVLNELDGLPDENVHCSKLSADTLHNALRNYLEERTG